jgi:hypothetical protein
MSKNPKKRIQKLPPAASSTRLLVHLAPQEVGLFRFLLESYDNLAGFTVLNRKTALLKVFFSPHQEQAARAALSAIAQIVGLQVSEWPV